VVHVTVTRHSQVKASRILQASAEEIVPGAKARFCGGALRSGLKPGPISRATATATQPQTPRGWQQERQGQL